MLEEEEKDEFLDQNQDNSFNFLQDFNLDEIEVSNSPQLKNDILCDRNFQDILSPQKNMEIES